MHPLALIKTKAGRIVTLLAAVGYFADLREAAAEPSRAIALANFEIVADPSCTTRADLIARVRARLPQVRLVDDDKGLAIRVQISAASAGGVAGDVTLVSPGMKPSFRRVPARSCVEAADAVALIIAVTLDPMAADTRSDGSTAALGTPSAAAPASLPNDSVTATGTTRTSVPKGKSSRPIAEPSSETSASESVSPRPRLFFGAQLAVEAVAGVTPGVMPGVSLFAMAGMERPSHWAPALVFGVHHAWRSAIEEQGGAASFTLDAASLDVCPLRFRLGVMEARPCGTLLFGRLAARGSNTLNPAEESARPFWAVGGAGILTADLPWRLQLLTRFVIGANLVRDSFEFSPATFHTVPPISAAASVGIGLHFR